MHSEAALFPDAGIASKDEKSGIGDGWPLKNPDGLLSWSLDSANTSNRKTLGGWMMPLDLVSYRVFRCLFEQAAMEARYF